MNNLIKTGRAFYAIGITGIAIQQFFYKDFRPVILPPWPTPIPGLMSLAFITGIGIIAAAAIMLFSKTAKGTAVILGCGLLLFFIAFQVTFQVFLSPYSFHFGLWTDPLKELALSGGAFIIAGTYPGNKPYAASSSFKAWPGRLTTLGRIFFSVTMIVFGLDHFIYTDFVATLVPAWMPAHTFWTYFAGVALMGSGIAIILKIKLKMVALLLSTMLFLWFLILHIPRAIADPYGNKGNESTSVFEALAFSGIALVIACIPRRNTRKAT